MFGWAGVAIRHRVTVTALTRLILRALAGLVAPMGMKAATAQAQDAGRGRLMGTAAAAAQRFRCPSFIGATSRPRNDLNRAPSQLGPMYSPDYWGIALGTVAVTGLLS